LHHPFDYEKPTNLEEAGALLAHASGNGCVLAGGSDVLLRIEEEAIQPHVLIDIKGLPELKKISFSGDSGLSLGATVTLSVLAAHSDVRRYYPLLAEVISRIGSARIRNRATIGGNTCMALPTSDLPPTLLCYDAMCHLWSPHGERVVPLNEFYTGFRQTVLNQGELLVRITLPTPWTQSRGVYHNLLQGQGGHITLVGAAVFARKKQSRAPEWRIALASVAPHPIRAYEAEAYLQTAGSGSHVVAQKAAELAIRAAQPSDDIQASASYRRAMVGVLVRRGVEDVFEQLSGRGG
jgi:carbon-monoxide dehydrogenase medium subunit